MDTIAGNGGKAEQTGGSGVCIAGAPGEYAAAPEKNEDRTGMTKNNNAGPMPSDSEPSGPEVADPPPPKKYPSLIGPGEVSPAMRAAHALEPVSIAQQATKHKAEQSKPKTRLAGRIV